MSAQPFRILNGDEIEAWWNDPANGDVRAFPRESMRCAVARPLAATNGQIVVVKPNSAYGPGEIYCAFAYAPIPDDLDRLARAFDRHKRSPDGMTARNVAQWIRRYRERRTAQRAPGKAVA